MEVIVDPARLKSALLRGRCVGRRIGLVPTMGYLHQGHVSLLRTARAENDVVVMSLFVNPAQFGPSEDFDRYPRDEERDLNVARDEGVDIVFAPSTQTMYPAGLDGQQVWAVPGRIADFLDGSSRPGHFRGVATVVAKLFTMVQPDRAYFGQKDAQQARIVQVMARDLAFQLDVIIVPTVREPDGLALSSRNVYLSPKDRAQAPALAAALRRAAEIFASGERHASTLEAAAQSYVREHAPLARLDFVTVADWETMQPIRGVIEGTAIMALAALFGSTRLIDNIVLTPG